MVNLIDDKIEIALTARGLSRDEVAYANEKGVEIIEKPIAIDALTFIINHQNPINSLSIEQIQGIYTGQYTNWKELGGPRCDNHTLCQKQELRQSRKI